ncbi:hypothetical protein [Sinorhizobium sp. RAC02]|uniref:hypothetical protein n=1 Tax=Sinorhizobium sp. RAC02 TaxID=1842534 RepID=UPI00083CBC6C|nr:hypothetical protein [Sinorhizobium sp. RAC02]AOF89220.1 hypothetical protein BSY16_2495 [Sinorhizobium sp. RAC02]
MSVQLARYLKDFGAPPRAKTPTFASPSFTQNDGGAKAEPFAMPLAEPQVDVAAERAEAFADGRAEAEAELAAKHEADMAALKEAHQAELDGLKARYEQDYADALAKRFSGLTAEVADLVAAQAAQVLAPIMSLVLTKGAVADLARMITEGLAGGEGITVTVKGPANLFEQLKSHFEDNMPVFKHVEMQDVDLTVEFSETVLVTRMAAWADTVRKVLA